MTLPKQSASALFRLPTPKILEILKEYRTLRVNEPERVMAMGEALLSRGYGQSGKDDVWEVLEQIAVPAAQCGELDLAETCLQSLQSRFPGSPRAVLLKGQIFEAEGLFLDAKELYDEHLKTNEHDYAVLKRLISLHLNSHSFGPYKANFSVEQGVEMLVTYLDTVYTDTEGWSTLADAYTRLMLYPQALTALSHLLLIAPTNPFYLLKHAETAYTAGEFSTAYKEFLRVIEVSGGVSGSGGPSLRAAIGAKLAIIKLSEENRLSNTRNPDNLNEIEQYITKEILDAYSNSKASPSSKQAVTKFLSEIV